MTNIEKIINDAWEKRDQINQNSDKSIVDAINQTIENLDQGKVRVAEKINNFSFYRSKYELRALFLSNKERC